MNLDIAVSPGFRGHCWPDYWRHYTGRPAVIVPTAALAPCNADTGVPDWAFPLGGAPSSGIAIAGNSVYLGAGTSFGTIDGQQVPPQATGVWGFTDLLSNL